jgi:hypothetical protein
MSGIAGYFILINFRFISLDNLVYLMQSILCLTRYSEFVARKAIDIFIIAFTAKPEKPYYLSAGYPTRQVY